MPIEEPGIGKGHMRVVGSFAFSKKTKNFFVSGSRFGSFLVL